MLFSNLVDRQASVRHSIVAAKLQGRTEIQQETVQQHMTSISVCCRTHSERFCHERQQRPLRQLWGILKYSRKQSENCLEYLQSASMASGVKAHPTSVTAAKGAEQVVFCWFCYPCCEYLCSWLALDKASCDCWSCVHNAMSEHQLVSFLSGIECSVCITNDCYLYCLGYSHWHQSCHSCHFLLCCWLLFLVVDQAWMFVQKLQCY